MTRIKIVLVAAILLLGLILRLHNYDKYPQRGASSDEYSYSFLGISLLTKHFPESWSNISAYQNKYDLTIRNLYFPMVNPYFDHPPLMGILTGSWSALSGQKTYETVDLKTIRLVPIFLSFISSILMFLIALKLFGYKAALWALLIFSTAVVFVMNQRVVFAENLLTPLFLGSLSLYLYAKRTTTLLVIAMAILAGLSFWTKELGIAVFFTLLYLFLNDRRGLKQTLILSGIFLAFFLGYLGYGYYFGGSLFWKITSIQATVREIGPEAVALFATLPVIVNKVYYDGWYLFGFLTLFFALFHFKKYKIIIVPFMVYFFLMIFSLAKEGEMGWYMLPLFPFMAIASAEFLNSSIGQKNWFIFLLLLFVGMYEVRYLFEENFGLVPLQFRIIVFILFAPLALSFLFKKQRFFTFLSNLWFYLLIAGTIYLVYNYVHPA